MKKDFKFNETITVFESFSGVGTQLMALNRLGISYKSVGHSEVDKFALLSYANIHTNFNSDQEVEYTKEYMVNYLQNKNIGYDFKKSKHTITLRNNYDLIKKYYLASINSNNYGDISMIKGVDLPQIDLFTYSFPCTDLTKAGKRKGLIGTSSGLVYEVLRILQELKQDNNLPKVLIMENVVDLVQTKFIQQFNEIQLELEQLGYNNYVETLNAKDYGVAQTRNRVFMVSILGNYNYQFPQPILLEKKLKDYLQPIEEIEDKYYLSTKALASFTDNINRNGFVRNERFNPRTRETCVVTSNYINEPLCLNSKVNGKQPSLQDRVYSSDAISTCVTTSFMPNITVETGVIIPEANKKGYVEAYEGDGVYINRPHQKRGVVQKGMIQTLKTSGSDVGVVVSDLKRKYWNKSIENGLRIRKLTPKECWRLMGIDDKDFEKASKVCSNSQLYKQAGNGIVVDVLVHIFKQLF